jgi:hypothetical protein
VVSMLESSTHLPVVSSLENNHSKTDSASLKFLQAQKHISTHSKELVS